MSAPIPTVSDTKRAFFQGFPKPINSVYRRAIDELLVETHLLTVSQTFRYDCIFALGWVTAFDGFTLGYKPEHDLPKIYHALVSALRLDPHQLRSDAQQLTELARSSPEEVLALLTTTDSSASLEPLSSLLLRIRSDGQFKYSRLFAIGIFRLLELVAPDQYNDSQKRQELLQTTANSLNISAEKLLRDQELYQSSLEKLKQSLQMMADLVEAERKKRQKLQPAGETVSSSNS